MTAQDHELATQVARAELVKRALIVVTTVMVTVILALLLVLISQIRATQQAGSPVLRAIIGQQDDIEIAARAASSTNDQILDCLEPTGECYKNSQERTADYLADFNRVVIYAAACASGPGKYTVEEIQACVIERLASDPKPAQP